MKRYVGINVAQERCALCIVDDAGTILLEGSCATDPDEIVHTIATEVSEVEKIVHESDPLSIWLTRELIKRGAPCQRYLSCPATDPHSGSGAHRQSQLYRNN